MNQSTLALPSPPPLLVIVSGPSGVGKDATLKRMQARGAPFHFLVTNTTRPRRPNEVEGVDYHFISPEEFQEKLERGDFLEHANVYGNWYGNSRRDVENALAKGSDVIMRIDVQGAATIRKKVKGAIFIFLIATLSELEARLRARRTESEEALRMRLDTAERELKERVHFDYCLRNHDSHLDQTVDDILAIIRAEKLRTHPRHLEFKSAAASAEIAED
ncbi:MAG TPA: guanylate kinase [Anaerolineae bacterium]|nr:guanylate kinase [Anaerolineae bacterium]